MISSDNGCSDHYEPMFDGPDSPCVKLEGYAATLADAKARCKEEGSNLVEVTSIQMQVKSPGTTKVNLDPAF